MPLNLGEASAVTTFLRWLGPYRGSLAHRAVPDDEVRRALVLLGAAAGKRLQLTYPADAIRALVDEQSDLAWLHARIRVGFGELQEQVHSGHKTPLDVCHHVDCAKARRWLLTREQLAEERR